MRNQDRSVGYFFLLLLAFAAGAVRLDADAPPTGAGEPQSLQSRPSLACSPADAAAQAPFCAASPAIAWTDS